MQKNAEQKFRNLQKLEENAKTCENNAKKKKQNKCEKKCEKKCKKKCKFSNCAFFAFLLALDCIFLGQGFWGCIFWLIFVAF